jgi:hypothetical protein
MVNRREMMMITAGGVVGVALAGGWVATGRRTPAQGTGMRFTIQGDMGTIRARSATDAVRVSGEFAERTTFTLN